MFMLAKFFLVDCLLYSTAKLQRVFSTPAIFNTHIRTAYTAGTTTTLFGAGAGARCQRVERFFPILFTPACPAYYLIESGRCIYV